MKKIIILSISCVIAAAAFAQSLGIDQASPSQKLDINGWLEVGNQSAPGTGSAGTFRYNTGGFLQFHNGSAWVDLTWKTKFINWGRPDCPATSTLVYSGQAGGARYDHSGSGYNTLCLSPAAAYADYNTGNQNGALVYGLEYEVNGYGVGSYGGVSPASLQNREAQCALCRVDNASAMLMVPGTTVCPSGWTQHYWGYLVSTHYTHNTAEWVCLNNTPTLYGSTANSDGDLWYPTEGEICSLRSPYVANREITCSVCTR